MRQDRTTTLPNASEPPATSRPSWLFAARVLWLLSVVPTLIFFVASIPAYYRQVATLKATGGFATPNPEGWRAGLEQLGLSVGFYAGYLTALQTGLSLAFAAIGVVVFWRKSHEWVAILVSLVLVTFGIGYNAMSLVLTTEQPAWNWLANPMTTVTFLCVVGMFYLFPDGRFVPRWTRMALVLAVTLAGPIILALGTRFDPSAWQPSLLRSLVTWLSDLLLPGLLLSMLIAQIYRYVRVSGPVQRQQTKWVVFGMVTVMVTFLGAILISTTFPELSRPGLTGVLYDLTSATVVVLAFLFVPVSIGISILRYRLFDIDVIVNRALVYGTLTALLAAAYFGMVALLQYLVRILSNQETSNFTVVASTLLIAALFQPLRQRIQGFIDRRFYRRKYDATRTLEEFGATLRDEVDLNALSDRLLATVNETIQPAHASLWLRPPERRT